VIAIVDRLKTLSRGGLLAWTDVPSRREQQVWPSAARRRSDRIADFSGRVAIVVLFTLLTMRISADFAETGRLTGLLLVAGEALVVVLTVLRRAAIVLDRSWRARIVTILSVCGPLMLRPAPHGELLPGWATVAVSSVGLAIVLTGKLSLGRSFGLMPANRGIVSSGLYRVLRHPIYAGYLLSHVAFLAAHASAWNIIVLATADLGLLVRAVVEERTLALDPAYVQYQRHVRWRVLPGVF
jgi:protein-S-isoprenylcysteine O-methyltransferase Ste14